MNFHKKIAILIRTDFLLFHGNYSSNVTNFCERSWKKSELISRKMTNEDELLWNSVKYRIWFTRGTLFCGNMLCLRRAGNQALLGTQHCLERCPVYWPSNDYTGTHLQRLKGSQKVVWKGVNEVFSSFVMEMKTAGGNTEIYYWPVPMYHLDTQIQRKRA